MKYLIASGWWSCDPKDDSREQLIGDSQLRDSEFHNIWKTCISKFTSASEIVVIDSASPLKPDSTEGETWISLRQNFGHSTNHITKFSGVSRSFMLSMMYAFCNDYDYWVYIEQDAVIYGERIIENAIEASRKNIIWGDGTGTAQPTQQSLMIFKTSEIPRFIQEYNKIGATDSEISPEWKFLFASNNLTRLLPTKILKRLANPKPSQYFLSKKIRNVLLRFIKLFDRFETLNFGYGRIRPLNLNDEYLYFQHGDRLELEEFLRKINYKPI